MLGNFSSLLESLEADLQSAAQKPAADPLIVDFLNTISGNLQANALSGEFIKSFTEIALNLLSIAASNTPIDSSLSLKKISQCLEMIDWLADLNGLINDISSQKELFYHQQALKEHLQEILESKSNIAMYSCVIGSIASDFSENICRFWAIDSEWISGMTMCYATTVFSVIAQYTTCVFQQLSKASIEQVLKSHPSEVVKIISKEKKKDRVKKRISARVIGNAEEL